MQAGRDRGPDTLPHFLDCAIRGDQDAALGLAAGDGAIGGGDAGGKGGAFGLEAALGGALAAQPLLGAGQRRRRLEIEDQRQIGAAAAAQEAIQFAHELDAQAASRALVGFGGVGEAIAEDDFAARQGGSDDALDVLGASGEEERELGAGRGRIAVASEHPAADGLAERRAPRLARDQHGTRQRRGQELELGRLAAAIHALEGDEEAGGLVGTLLAGEGVGCRA